MTPEIKLQIIGAYLEKEPKPSCPDVLGKHQLQEQLSEMALQNIMKNPETTNALMDQFIRRELNLEPLGQVGAEEDVHGDGCGYDDPMTEFADRLRSFKKVAQELGFSGGNGNGGGAGFGAGFGRFMESPFMRKIGKGIATLLTGGRAALPGAAALPGGVTLPQLAAGNQPAPVVERNIVVMIDGQYIEMPEAEYRRFVEAGHLLPAMELTKEQVSPAPMTSVTTGELRKAWGDKVTIWGSIPAVLFEPSQYSDEEFDDYVKTLFREVAPGDNFIMGMGDNLPFDGDINRVGRVAELISKYGRLPIEF